MQRSRWNSPVSVLTAVLIPCLLAGPRRAAAQDTLPRQDSNLQGHTQFATLLDTSWPRVEFQDASPLSAPPDRLRFERAELPANRNVPLSNALHVRSTTTPFGRATFLPVWDAWGGHIELGGYRSVATAENILAGLPGAGSIPPGQTPFSLSPEQSRSYGVALTLHLGVSRATADLLSPQRWIALLFHPRQG
jgi:hypothetical protein